MKANYFPAPNYSESAPFKRQKLLITLDPPGFSRRGRGHGVPKGQYSLYDRLPTNGPPKDHGTRTTTTPGTTTTTTPRKSTTSSIPFRDEGAPVTTASLRLVTLTLQQHANISHSICMVPRKWKYGKIILLTGTDSTRVVLKQCCKRKCPKKPFWRA
ncbi:hypothetical protein PoB_006943300 [Plakobranchus ocellatus]|uniref:Uncharacterized protein n=1 Tax=Plakobranchus ocellatus TaxID=259542 RepID=A0AAV4DFB6_9GAST|nr:hypothetical protein PoB_006943300 [Plakobranchus ocellatus]